MLLAMKHFHYGEKKHQINPLYICRKYITCLIKNIDLTLILIQEATFVLNNLDLTLRKLLEEFSKNNIEFIFVKNYRKLQDKYEAYKDMKALGDNHFNENGNRLIAKEILENPNT